jgi:uncharacterized membrane protein
MSKRRAAKLSLDQRPRSLWPFPVRFVLFLAVLPIATAALVPLVSRWGQAVLGGFDLAALAFIVSLWPLTRDHTVTQMREKARANDAGRAAMLVITSLVTVVILTAVAVELPGARHETGMAHVIALATVLLSLVIAWLFGNLIFALHYTHLFYRDHAEGGLNFPKPDPDTDADEDGANADNPESGPDYLDFAYYALTIGMAFATSDITVPGRTFRRTTIVHAIIAFFYNLIVLAFTINVTAGS